MKILRYIKNILIIVCLSFSIITSISKCHAYTFEQFKQFLDACYENNITTNAMTKNDLKFAIDNWYKIENTITQNNIDLTPYTSFAIRSVSNGHISTQGVMYVWFFRSISYAGSDNNGGNFQIETPNATTIYIRTTQTEQLKYVSKNTWYDSFCCGIFAEKLNLFNTDTLTNTKWEPNDHPITPPFDYTPYGILSNDDWYYQKFAYTGNICLGKLGVNDFYQLDINFKNPNGVKLGTISIVPGVGTIDDKRCYFFTKC